MARLYSQRVRLRNNQEGLDAWSIARARLDCLFDAVRLVEVALILGGDGDASSSALRRAAELLEWIGDLADTDAAPSLVPLSAACYQLAGYPARASGVLRSAAPEARGSLLGLLLAGDFERLLEESNRVVLTFVYLSRGESRRTAMTRRRRSRQL